MYLKCFGRIMMKICSYFSVMYIASLTLSPSYEQAPVIVDLVKPNISPFTSTPPKLCFLAKCQPSHCAVAKSYRCISTFTAQS